MDRRNFIACAGLGTTLPLLGLNGTAHAAAAPAPKVSGPHVHENLAIYFVHGVSAPGPVPLTLQEAMAKGKTIVHETGDVNRLIIENRGDEEVYVQAGDIVKGGKQDRVLTVSMLLPKRSAPTPIAAYCVEEGRWSARGGEDTKKFASSDTAVVSKDAKLAMKAPSTPGFEVRNETARRQQAMWRDVAKTQAKLAASLGGQVAAPESRSSLQLSLENDRVKATMAAYVKALTPVLDTAPDAIGFLFAINGKFNSADLYPSHGLLRKLWPKLLAAAATEAVSEKGEKTAAAAPTAEQAAAFLVQAEKGTPTERTVDKDNRLEMRADEKSYYFESRRADGTWVHRNYIAR